MLAAACRRCNEVCLRLAVQCRWPRCWRWRLRVAARFDQGERRDHARPQPIESEPIIRAADLSPQRQSAAVPGPPPRAIGDLLTIELNETLNASQSATSNTEKRPRPRRAAGGQGCVGMAINGLNTTASADNAFNGTGATSSSGLFTGPSRSP